MTGYTVHTGTTVKFSEGWDKVFSKGAKKNPAAVKTVAKKSTSAKKATKASAKKRSGR